MSLSQVSAQFRFLFWLFVRLFCSRLFAKFFDLRSWLSVSSPHRSVGTPTPLPRGSFLSNQEKTTYLVHITWNFVEGSCISGNQKKGTSFIRKPNNKKGTLLLSSFAIYGRMLLPWLLFRPRAPVVVLGSKLLLPMRSSWPVFPGIGPGSFPPMVFLVFWDSIPKRCQGVHCVDLGESFPTSIYLQNLASIQPRTSLVKFARSLRTDYYYYYYYYYYYRSPRSSTWWTRART